MVDCLKIEIRKCYAWLNGDHFEIRIGDLGGETTFTGISKAELLDELKRQVDEIK